MSGIGEGPKSRGAAKDNKKLGQYWTPPVVAEFMLELVGFDSTWRVIDPACGEGVFLLKAIERGCGVAVGVDIDPEAIDRAKKVLDGYLDRVRLYCQDGLDPINDTNAFWQEGYDLVIGNPPFAATGYRVRDPAILERFELSKVTVSREPSPQLPLLEVEKKRPKVSVAIEVLFLERFVQLCRNGGRVCIILPEGIFANSSLRHVREWLVRNFTVRAVIGLPRDTFKSSGTTAKTDILYLEKAPSSNSHRVFLAEVTKVKVSEGAKLNKRDNPQLIAVLRAFKKLMG